MAPSKQAIRDYMQSRAQSIEPPPPVEEIRRQLGWYLREERQDEFNDAPMEY
jgi:hypothetical protein